MDMIKGFCEIKKDATTCKGAMNPKEFIGECLAVHDFGVDDCVLVLNRAGTALAMFDKEDVIKSFKCGYVDGIVTPPGLNFIEQMTYLMRVRNRKGGHSPILTQMVIQASLWANKFDDRILWAKQ